ncbi:MAG: LacI family DNA-binding transcriptional regulator [Pseudomonadota bacterium]
MFMRPTTKDLANHLGMSRSTVDRVLNGRPGVKAKTVKAVHKAIEELGFERNLSAANLARKRVYRFAYFLPKAEGEFLHELQSEIRSLGTLLGSEGVEITVKRSLAADPHKTVKILSKIDTSLYDGVAILAPDSPQVRDAVIRIKERGVHVVRLISGAEQTGSVDFVGIDNMAAGRTAARLLGSFSKAENGKVAVITESMQSTDSAARRNGFDAVLQDLFPQLEALPTLETYGDKDRASEILSACFRNHSDIVGLYAMGTEASRLIPETDVFSPRQNITIIAHERTKMTLNHLAQGKIDALIVQDPGHVIRSAIRKLRAQCDQRPLISSQDQIRIEILLKENLTGQHTSRQGEA